MTFINRGPTFLLVAAVVLGILACLSVPSVHSFYVVSFTEGMQGTVLSEVKWGLWGYCYSSPTFGDRCARRNVQPFEGQQYAHLNSWIQDTYPGGFFLEAIATALTFIAFLFTFSGNNLTMLIAAGLGMIALGLTIASLYLEHMLYVNVRNYYYENILNNDGDKFALGPTYTFGAVQVALLGLAIVTILLLRLFKRSKRQAPAIVPVEDEWHVLKTRQEPLGTSKVDPPQYLAI